MKNKKLLPLNNNAYILTTLLIITFLILNILKIVIFRNILTSNAFYDTKYISQYIQTFNYPIEISRAFSLLFVIYTLIFKSKWRHIFVVFYCIQFLYTFINLTFYFYSQSYLHIYQAILLFKEGLQASKSLLIINDIRLLTTLIDFPFFIILIKYYPYVNKVIKKIPYRIIIPMIILSMFSIYSMNFSWLKDTITRRNFFGERIIVKKYGTLVNNFCDLLRYGDEKKIISRFDYGNKLSFKNSSDKPNNIIVIQVESMNSNIIRFRYKDKCVMPFLNKLSYSGIYYPRLISHHYAGGSSDAEFVAINSIEPTIGFPAFRLRTYDYPNSIAKKLTQRGYVVSAFHGNTADFFNRGMAFTKMGFQSFYDINDMKLCQEGWGASDSAVFQFVKNKLAKEKNPLFYYIITMSSHAPFSNVENYYHNNHFDDINNHIEKAYLNSMSYVDRELSRFVNFIKDSISNSYVLVFGDHSVLVEGTFYSTKSSYIPGVEFAFGFVPLLILTPYLKSFHETQYVTTFIDLAPTILAGTGLNISMYSSGLNLLERINDGYINFEDGKYKRSELFMKTSSDSSELRKQLMFKYIYSEDPFQGS